MSGLAGARRLLYWLARLLGDAQALRRERLRQRLYNRAVGRGNARLMRRVWWR